MAAKRTYSKVGCADCGWQGSAGIITRYGYVNGHAQPYEARPKCESRSIFGQLDFKEFPDLYVRPWIIAGRNDNGA